MPPQPDLLKLGFWAAISLAGIYGQVVALSRQQKKAADSNRGEPEWLSAQLAKIRRVSLIATVFQLFVLNDMSDLTDKAGWWQLVPVSWFLLAGIAIQNIQQAFQQSFRGGKQVSQARLFGFNLRAQAIEVIGIALIAITAYGYARLLIGRVESEALLCVLLVAGIDSLLLLGFYGLKASAPMVRRFKWPCEPITDGQTRIRLEQLFKRAGLSTPGLWFAGIDEFGMHDAELAGFKSRFAMTPSLFLTRSFLDHLDSEEFDALILNEASHLARAQGQKRLALTAVVVFSCTVITVLAMIGFRWNGRYPVMVSPSVLMSIMVYFLLLRWWDRYDIFDRDSHASIVFDVKPAALASGLRKVYRLNNVLPNDEESASALGLPTLSQRVAEVNRRIELHKAGRDTDLRWERLRGMWRGWTGAFVVVLTVLWAAVIFNFVWRAYPIRQLRVAAAKGELDRVKTLVSRGSSVNAEDSTHGGTTPLVAATCCGQVETVKWLLQNGADADAINPNGQWPLMEAARQGNAEIVEQLLDHGAAIDRTDSDGMTPLMRSIAEKNQNAALALIRRGADWRLRDHSGQTAVDYANNKGLSLVVEALMARGAAKP